MDDRTKERQGALHSTFKYFGRFVSGHDEHCGQACGGFFFPVIEESIFFPGNGIKDDGCAKRKMGNLRIRTALKSITLLTREVGEGVDGAEGKKKGTSLTLWKEDSHIHLTDVFDEGWNRHSNFRLVPLESEDDFEDFIEDRFGILYARRANKEDILHLGKPLQLFFCRQCVTTLVQLPNNLSLERHEIVSRSQSRHLLSI